MKRFFLFFVALLSVLMLNAQPKYIFYFIGDGMGQNQVLAAEMYLAELSGQIGRKQLCMTQFPYVGLASTYSKSNSITDSSAAGTCLASGEKTTNGYLGVTPDGQHPQTIAEALHNNGWAVGITTSVSIDHATPGAFYAHSSSRNNYYEIGKHLTESNFEFFGGSSFLAPNSPDDPNAENLYVLCEQSGYSFCRGYKDFQANGLRHKKVILVQEHEALEKEAKGDGRLPYAIDRKEGDLELAQITKAAIDFLYNKNRSFFLMVEGGQIDWACHGDDAATTIHEVIDFDKAIREAYEFYKQHPDETLIVVTADHETGGMALGNSDYNLRLARLQYQKASSTVISEQLKALHKEYGKKLTYNQVKDLFSELLGLYTEVEVSASDDATLRATYKLMMKNKAADSKNMYASLNALSDKAVQILDKKARIGWTTHSHSASAVPVFAIGNGAEHFTGFYDNSDIAPRLRKLTVGN